MDQLINTELYNLSTKKVTDENFITFVYLLNKKCNTSCNTMDQFINTELDNLSTKKVTNENFITFVYYLAQQKM